MNAPDSRKPTSEDPLALIERQKDKIASLCRLHHVCRLEVFGSAVAGGFRPGQSDIDFLIDFQEGADLGPWLRVYFDLRTELENLLGHPVDLVQITAPDSQLFWDEAEKSRRLVYAA